MAAPYVRAAEQERRASDLATFTLNDDFRLKQAEDYTVSFSSSLKRLNVDVAGKRCTNHNGRAGRGVGCEVNRGFVAQ